MAMILIFASLLATAAAVTTAPAAPNQGLCLLSGVAAVDQASDAAQFLWAAYERCGKSGKTLTCTIDVASAVQSAEAMVNIIVKALGTCSNMTTANSGCAASAGVLTKNVAGLVAASAAFLHKCPIPLPGKDDDDEAFSRDGIQCLINSKDSARSVITVLKEFLDMNRDCIGKNMTDSNGGVNKACLQDVLRVTAGFASIGQYVAGSFGHCIAKGGKESTIALCAQGSLQLLDHAAKVAAAGTDLSRKCNGTSGPPSNVPNMSKLFIEDDVEMGHVHASRPTFGGFLPVTACIGVAGTIAGFAGGRYFGHREMEAEHNAQLGPLE